MRYFFVGLTLLFGCSVFGQEHRVKQFSVDDGLPSSHVYEVKQDKQGFYWIATDKGVVTYDGYSFKEFTEPNSPFNKDIWWTHQDMDSKVWGIGFADSLSFWNKDSFSFKKLEFSGYSFKPKFNKIFQDNFENYWLTAGSSLFGFNENESSFIPYDEFTGQKKKNEPHRSRASLFQDKFRNTYRITKDPIQVWKSNETGVFDMLFTYPVSILSAFGKGSKRNEPIADNLPGYNDKNTTFIHHTYDSLYLIRNNKISGLFNGDSYDLGEFPKQSILKQKSYQVQEVGGKFVFLHSAGNFVTDLKFKHIPEYDFIKDYKINTVYEDHENSLWISTINQGIFYITKASIASKSYATQSDFKSEIIGIVKDTKKTTWVGYVNGNICRISEDDILCFQVSTNHDNDVFGFVRDIELLNNHLIVIVGNYETHVYNLQHIDFSNPKPDRVFDFGLIKSMVKTPQGSMLISDYLGLFELDINAASEIELRQLTSGTALCGSADTSENLIFQTREHLVSVSISSDTTVISNSLIARKFALSPKHNQYIINTNQGVSRLIKYKSLPIDALSNYYVEDLFFENEESLWAATNKGLIHFNYNSDKNNFEFNQAITTANGLLTTDVTNVLVNENEIYVGTTKGLNVIDKSMFTATSKGHNVLLKSLTVKGKKLQPSNTYNFGPEQNSLDLNYVYISPKSSGQITYTYKLEGIDTEWKQTKETKISYPFLPPGNYHFELKATDINGIESAKNLNIGFSIDEYWWKTTWFIVLAISCFVILTILLFVLRIKQLNARAKEKTEVNNRIAELRLNALQSQMNPHFVFNVLNSIQEGFLTNKIEEANQYMSDFAKLMRLFLESSDDKFILLSKEINLLTHYVELERMRLDNKFQYNFELHQEIDTDEFKVPTMLLQPIIENAILHGLRYKKGAGNLDVKFSLLDNTKLVITITDNGVGRKKSAEINSRRKKSHNSKATGIINERISIINSTEDQRIQIKYTDLVAGDEALGTSVELSLDLEINR